MKILASFLLMIFCHLSIISFAGVGNDTTKEKPSKNAPVFLKVSYQGADQVYKDFPLRPDEFYSPILQGCYPDPSITRKGDDYYLVCSSFAMFPGVPIFHSKDLVNWEQIGHVLDRTTQLKVEDCGISAGGQSEVIATTEINLSTPVQLQVKATGDNYSFSYSLNGTDFINLGGTVSGDILSTNVAGGFTGCLIGLYATSANDTQPVL